MKNAKNIVKIMILGLLAVAVGACTTKKKEVVSKLDPSVYYSKSDFANKRFHMQIGIEEAASDNQIGATPGMSDDYGIVEARITEKELRLYSVFKPNGRSETNKLVAAFAITKHFDIKREENDFKEQTNKIVEDTERPWNERQYMRVDWSQPTNDEADFARSIERAAWDPTFKVSAFNSTVLDNPKVESDGHISWPVETHIKSNGPFEGLFNSSMNESYYVRYRTHLMPVKKSDFQPIEYSLKDFEKFGYFFTQQDWIDPEKGLRDSGVKRYANVHNVCESGLGLSCSTNKVVWVLSKDFPDMYKPEARRAVQEWNETFKKALGRSDDVVVLDESAEVEITDPRKNVIAYYPHQTNAGLLGVAQWVSHPETGEFVSVRATVYEDGIKGVVGQVDLMIDLLASDKPMDQIIGSGDFGISQEYASAFTGGRIRDHMEMMDRNLGIEAAPKAGPAAPGTLRNQVRRAQEKLSTPAVAANLRKARLAEKAPWVLAIKHDAAVGSLAKSKTPFPATIAGTETKIPNVFGLEKFIFNHEKTRADKARALRDAKRGIHGTEMVEEAAVRYLLSLVSDGRPASKLQSMKAQIKETVAKETFYTTLLHEMGHAFGLRHNFEGSADEPHYHHKHAELKAKTKDVKSGVKKADLEPYAFSSIMDYGADFYSQVGGLGPYDNAAIRYAYNRTIDKKNDEVTTVTKTADGKIHRHEDDKKFRFCTDHQVGETILCRRWDKGSNVTEITMNAIGDYHTNWSLRHSRRDRANWSEVSGLFGYLIDRVMMPARQTMDEFIYTLVASIYDEKMKVPADQRQGSFLCDLRFVKESLDRGEILNVCNELAMEEAGVDPSDLGTLYAALFNEEGELLKDPATYTPYGFADLLYSNLIARNFFQEVITSAEPGVYVALEPQDKRLNRSMVKIWSPDDGPIASHVDLLRRFAERNGYDPDAMVAEYADDVVDFKISDGAKPFGSVISNTAGQMQVESIGSFYDKYAAILTLTARDIGANKYAAVDSGASQQFNLSGNAYLFPQTKKFTAGLFNALITNSPIATTVNVKLKNGQVVKANVGSALNSDTQQVALFTAFSEFMSDDDTSLTNKFRICDVTDEARCRPTAPGRPVVSFVSSETTNKFTAAQTVENDSFAFGIVSLAKKTDTERAKWIDMQAKAGDIQKANIKKLDGAGELRARLESNFAKVEELAEIGKSLTSLDPRDMSSWITLKTITNSLAQLPTYMTQAAAQEVVESFVTAAGAANEVLAAMGDEGICKDEPTPESAPVKEEKTVNRPIVTTINQAILDDLEDLESVSAQAQVSQPAMTSDCASQPAAVKRAALTQALNDLEEVTKVIVEILESNLNLKAAPSNIEDLSHQLSQREKQIETIRSFMKAVGAD